MLSSLFGVIPYEGNTTNPRIICILDTKILYNYNSASKPFSSKDEYEFYGKNFITAGIYAGDDVLFIGATNRVTAEVYDKDKLLGEVLKECKDIIATICAHYKPKLVIAIGKTGARQAFGKAAKITEARGIPAYSSFLDCTVFPLFGFGQVMRNPDQQEYYLADMLTLKRLLANDCDINKSLVKRTMVYQWCTDLSFLIKNPPKQMVVDCETVGLEWFRKDFRLLTVQFCYEAGTAFVVPLDYPLYYEKYGALSNFHKQRLRNQLRILLRNPNIEFIGHNLKFDFHAIRARLGVKIANFAHDTMLMLHTLNENMTRKSLDEGVRMFVPGMSGFNDQHNKDPEHQAKTRMDLLNPDKMLEYGAGDVDGCFQLFHELTSRLQQDPRSYNYYKNIVIPAIRTFADVEVNGFYIDENALRAFEKKLAAHQEIECKWLLDTIPSSIKRLHENTGVGLKPDRAVILIDYLFNHHDGLRLKPLVFTKTSTADKPIPSTSTKDHLPYFEHIEFVVRLQDYVKNQKLLTTYVSGFYKYIDNGRIRPTYSLHKTVTSRSSCIHGDTPIPTSNGVKQAKDIQIGDLVYTHKGRLKPVVNLFIKPVQEMFNVYFSDGNVLCCTEDHKLLTCDGEWISLRDGYFKETSKRQTINDTGSESLSHLLANDGSVCKTIQNRTSHRIYNVKKYFTFTGATETQSIKVFRLKRRQPKSDERKQASKLQRRLRRRLRVSYDCSSWETLFCSSNSFCRTSFRDKSRGFTKSFSNSSYRRKPSKQSSGQPSSLHQCSASRNSSEIQNGQQHTRITRIEPSGSHKVYDFEVKDDHSYAACGVFSHNSESPNGQNFPKRGPLAKEYRKIFVCPEGWVLLEADYSQIEIKLAAIYANEKNMLSIFKDNGDIHMATAAGVMGITLEEFKQLPTDIRKLKRTQAKAVVFGFLYGMWWKKFKTYAKTQYGLEFTDKEAEETRKAFFRTYPGIEVWHSEVQRIAKKQGFVRSFSGRIRHLPNVNSSDEMAAKEACRQGINAPVQELGNSLGLASISILNNNVSHNSLRLCGYIHDAIVFLSKKEDAMQNIGIIKTCMENLPLKELFNFNSPIQFTTGISIGYNLSEMHEIENDAIYKDKRVTTSDDIIQYLTTPPKVVIKKKRNRLKGA